MCVCLLSLLKARWKVNSGLTPMSSPLPHLNTQTHTHIHAYIHVHAWGSPHLLKGTCPRLSSHLSPPLQKHKVCVYTHTDPDAWAFCDVNKVRDGAHAWIMTHHSTPLTTAAAKLHLPSKCIHTHSVRRWPSHPHKRRTQRNIKSPCPLSHTFSASYITHVCGRGGDYWICLLTTPLLHSQTMTCFLPHPVPHLLPHFSCPCIVPHIVPNRSDTACKYS